MLQVKKSFLQLAPAVSLQSIRGIHYYYRNQAIHEWNNTFGC